MVEARANYASSDHYVPFSLTRVQPVVSGTKKFYLTTMTDNTSDEFEIRNLRLTAMFFPTAYGSVEATGPSADTPEHSELYDARGAVEAERAAELEAQRRLIEAKVQGSARNKSDK